METIYHVLMVLFLILCSFLILLVLIQKGRGGGITSAFGGGGGGNTAFGTKTADMVVWATTGVFACFIVLAVALNLIADRIGHPQPQQTQQVPANSSAPMQMPGAGGAGAGGAPTSPK